MTNCSGIKPSSPDIRDSSGFSSSNEFSRTLERQSSFRQICEISVTFCRRNSKDLKSRLDVFLRANSSTLEAIEKHFVQVYRPKIQRAISYLVLCAALLILISEMFWCLSLLSSIPFEPGFCFLLILVIIVCVGINGKIMTHLLQAQSSPASKDKSKEV